MKLYTGDYRLWAIFQAVAKELQGIKAIEIMGNGYLVAIFPTKEAAKLFLKLIIQNIKKEQRQGIRTADNLDPHKKLDWVIAPISVEVDEQEFKVRGWYYGHMNDM